MAGPGDTGNVDTNSINDAAAHLGVLQTIIDKLGTSFQGLLDKISGLGGKVSTQTKDAEVGAKSLWEQLKALGEAAGDAGNKSFSKMSNDIDNAAQGANKLKSIMMGIGELSISGTMFNDFKTGSEADITSVESHIEQITDLIGKVPGLKKISGGIENFAQNAAQGEKLENTYIALAASTGRLNGLFSDSGKTLENLSATTAQYSKNVVNNANAVGLDAQQVLGYAATLGQIPGLVDTVANYSGNASDSTNGLVAAMKLMIGSGRSMKEVNDEMTEAYENIGQARGALDDTTSSKKEVEFFATISDTANTLGVRFQDVRTVLDQTAKDFKYVGDNTAAAATILGTYTQALEKTGLTAKASTDLVGKMIGGVSQLTTAQKAFISSQSGGPGGLQGAFKIEQMMRQGKTQDVMAMAEKVMRQKMGGRIYGLDEAAQGGQAAAQFMKQREMVKSGIFGVGAGASNEEATRILEALRDRNVSGFNAIATGSKAVGDVMTKSAAIQKNNQDSSKIIANNTSGIYMMTAIMANAQRKEYLGEGVGNRRGKNAQLNEDMTDRYMAEARKGEPKVTKVNYDDTNDMLLENATQLMSQVTAAVNGTAANLRDDAKSTMDRERAAQANIAPGNRQGIGRAAMAHGPAAHQMARPIVDAHQPHAAQMHQRHGAGQPVDINLNITVPPGFHVQSDSKAPGVSLKLTNGNAGPQYQGK